MKRCVPVLLAFLSFAAVAAAQSGRSASEEKGTHLGVLFSPVPEVLADHLPDLPRDCGVLVTHVLPKSPAAKAGLRRHDILLRFGEKSIRDSEHLARLIRTSKEGQEVSLVLVRGGRETTAAVTLELGPILRIAKDLRGDQPAEAKPGGPAPLSVTAVPLEGNRLKLTFEYSEAGRFRTYTCSGTAREIDSQVEKLPEAVQAPARVAIKRLRDLEFQIIPMAAPAPTKKPR